MDNIRCHKQNDSPNRNDLSSFLKVINDVEVERRAGGKLFHARGPATANARSPMDARRVDGTTRSSCIGWWQILYQNSIVMGTVIDNMIMVTIGWQL